MNLSSITTDIKEELEQLNIRQGKRNNNMEILVDNFAEKLDFMIKSITSADFITIDTEFSGLSIGYEDKTHGFD